MAEGSRTKKAHNFTLCLLCSRLPKGRRGPFPTAWHVGAMFPVGTAMCVSPSRATPHLAVGLARAEASTGLTEGDLDLRALSALPLAEGGSDSQVRC